MGQGCLQPEVVEILEEQPGCVIARVPLRTWQLAKLVQHKIDHSLNARVCVCVCVCCAHVDVCIVCVLCVSRVCVCACVQVITWVCVWLSKCTGGEWFRRGEGKEW